MIHIKCTDRGGILQWAMPIADLSTPANKNNIDVWVEMTSIVYKEQEPVEFVIKGATSFIGTLLRITNKVALPNRPNRPNRPRYVKLTIQAKEGLEKYLREKSPTLNGSIEL